MNIFQSQHDRERSHKRLTTLAISEKPVIEYMIVGYNTHCVQVDNGILVVVTPPQHIGINRMLELINALHWLKCHWPGVVIRPESLIELVPHKEFISVICDEYGYDFKSGEYALTLFHNFRDIKRTLIDNQEYNKTGIEPDYRQSIQGM